jgi:hypothetical protein
MSQQDSDPIWERIIVTGVLCLSAVGFFYLFIVPNRPRSHTSNAWACINNMRQIEAAKNEWALEQGKTNGTAVTTDDITPYIQLNRYSKIPPCPSGGTYTIGKIGELPTCSIGTNDRQPHVLMPKSESRSRSSGSH